MNQINRPNQANLNLQGDEQEPGKSDNQKIDWSRPPREVVRVKSHTLEDELGCILAGNAFNPGVWETSYGRTGMLDLVNILTRGAREPGARQKAVQLLDRILADEPLEQSEEDIDRRTFYRGIQRHHLFTLDPKAPQVHSASLADRIDEAYADRSQYEEVPFDVVYPLFKSNVAYQDSHLGIVVDAHLPCAQKSSRILDLAIGGGTEMRHLLERGWNVVGNDLDPAFILKTRATLEKSGLSAPIIQGDWKKLTETHELASYDAAYLVGNSLAYIHDRSDQLRALSEIRKVLKPGGALVIDSRNYDKILDDRDHILLDPIRNFQYMYMHTYTGDQRVFAHPVNIEDDNVIFEYLCPERAQKSYLELYPFRQSELEDIFLNVGFKILKTVYDCDAEFTEKTGHHDFVLWVLESA